MRGDVRALSLWQPWASAIALGSKHIETRSWMTDYTGTLLIHAAKRRVDEDGLDLVIEMRKPLTEWPGEWSDLCPLGAVVAVATLRACWPTTGTPPSREEGPWGDFSPGRWCWLLDGVIRLDVPVPAKGARGLWTPDAAVVDAVRAQVEGRPGA